MLHVLRQAGAVTRVGEGKFAECLKVALKIPDIKTPCARREPQAQHLAAGLDEGANGVGQLNLATLARRRLRRSEEHTSELQSHLNLVCRLLLEKKKQNTRTRLTSRTQRCRCLCVGRSM